MSHRLLVAALTAGLVTGCAGSSFDSYWAAGQRLQEATLGIDPGGVDGPPEWVVVEQSEHSGRGNSCMGDPFGLAYWEEKSLIMELLAMKTGRRYTLPSPEARASYREVRADEDRSRRFVAKADDCRGTVVVKSSDDKTLEFDLDLAVEGTLYERDDEDKAWIDKGRSVRRLEGRHSFSLTRPHGADED